MHYYFAYGSNVDAKQMRERCRDHKFLGTAVLQEYRLAFTIYSPRRKCGCADLIPSLNNYVAGILYEISDKDMERLDRFENVFDGMYRRTRVLVSTQSGLETLAYTYVVVNKSEGLLPSSDYVGIIREAARIFSFPKEYQLFLASIKTKD